MSEGRVQRCITAGQGHAQWPVMGGAWFTSSARACITHTEAPSTAIARSIGSGRRGRGMEKYCSIACGRSTQKLHAEGECHAQRVDTPA